MTLGGRLAPDARDVRHSRLIVIWGHNPASTSPHFMPFMREAQRDGAYVVVIDPRRSTTARSADEHLRPRPATDGALALGLMHVLFAEGLHDEAWLRQHSVGWEDLRQRVKEYPPRASRRDHRYSGGADRGSGSPLWHDQTGPAEVCRRHPAAWQRRSDVSRARLACRRSSGQIGVRGGGLYYSTSDYVSWRGEALSHRSECPPEPRRINMNRLGAALTGEVTDPPIMSLYVFAANPVGASPKCRPHRRGDAARRPLHRRPRAVHDRYRAAGGHRAPGDDPVGAGRSAQALRAAASAVQPRRHRPAGGSEEQLGRQPPPGDARWATTNRGSTTSRRRCCARSWTPPGRRTRLWTGSPWSGCRLKGPWRTRSRTTTRCRSPMATSRRRRARSSCAARPSPRLVSIRCLTTSRPPSSWPGWRPTKLGSRRWC